MSTRGRNFPRFLNFDFFLIYLRIYFYCRKQGGSLSGIKETLNVKNNYEILSHAVLTP